jgi:hypothetical protein
MSTDPEASPAAPPHPVSARQSIFVRAAAAMLASALAMLAALSAGNAWRGASPVDGPVSEGGWTGRTRAWFTARGVYPSELDAASSRSFTWTHGDGFIRIPVLDRRAAHTVRLDVRGIGAAPGRPPQQLTLSVDGVVVQQAELSGRRQTFEVGIPASPAKSALVGFALSATFVPGPQDRRQLGMIIDGLALSAPSSLRPPARALWPALAAALALGLALGLVSGSLWWALALAVAGGLGQGMLLGLDAAFLGDVYVWRLWRIDLAALACACIALVLSLQRVGWLGRGWLDRGWRIALPAVLVLCAIRIAVFSHPFATIGDSIFHVHRAELVQRGSYFFTSVTPRPFFEFPYAPGLYVAASPLWTSFPSQAEHVMLLRTLGLVVDALAALAVFAAVRRYWGLGAGAVAATIFQLVPIGLHTFCTANLTNAFSQSLFAAALMLWVWSLSRPWAPAAAALFSALLAAAFLSHFSTLSTGVPIVLAVGVALLAARGPERSRWTWTLASLLLALLVSYAIYYSHFHEVYAKTLERVMAREGAEASRSMVAPVSVKLARFVHAVRAEYFGLPLLGGALAGVAVALSRRSRDALTLVVGGWLLVVAGFLALGVFTPIEMRAALAGQPVVAALLGLCAAALWQSPWFGRPAAVLLVGAVVYRGCADWLLCLGLLSH